MLRRSLSQSWKWHSGGSSCSNLCGGTVDRSPGHRFRSGATCPGEAPGQKGLQSRSTTRSRATKGSRSGPAAGDYRSSDSSASPPTSAATFSEVLARAEAAAKAQQYDPAIADYRKALAMNPESVDARLGLAETLYDAKRYPDAEKEFRQVLSARSGLAEAQRGLGDTLYELRRYSDAVTAYSASEQAGIKDAELYNNFGNALIRTRTVENKRRAIDAYRKAIALKPDWSDAHAGLAHALRTAVATEGNRSLEEAIDGCEESGRAGRQLCTRSFDSRPRLCRYEGLRRKRRLKDSVR